MESAEITKQNKTTTKQQKTLLIVLGVIILVGLFLAYGHMSYKKGYDTGKEAGKKEVASTANLLSNLSNPFQSLSGKIVDVNSTSLTIKTAKGENKTIALNKTTKVSKDSNTQLKISDLEKNQNVSVFTSAKGNDVVASRIIIRD